MMKKLLIATMIISALSFVYVCNQAEAAIAFSPAELGIYGSPVALPITAPTNIDIMDGSTLRTVGSVDFSVLYNSSTSVYSYFYQIFNADSGVGAPIGRFTFNNPSHFAVLGSGVMGDGLDAVYLDTSNIGTMGAYLDPDLSIFGGPHGNMLTVGETTNRFFFQFAGEPNIVTGYLIDGGIGGGPVVGPMVPEPTSMMLLGMGILGLFGFRRKI